MVESKITQAILVKDEPAVADFLRTGESDVSTYITQALVQLNQDIKDRGYDLRRIGKRLSLYSSTTKTADATGTKTDEDYIERLRLTVNVTAKSGTSCYFTLQGTNDDSSETWTTITLDSDSTSLTVTATGDTTQTFSTPYRFYRLNFTLDTMTSLTYSAYLVETTFEEPHKLLSLAKIFNSRRYADTSDIYSQKYHEYLELYYKKLDSMRIYSDDDDDDSISSSEKGSVGIITLGR